MKKMNEAFKSNSSCTSHKAAPSASMQKAINYKEALRLACQGDLYYRHCDSKVGVTSDPYVSMRMECDSLVATTEAPKVMASRGFTKVEWKVWATMLHTLLSLVDTCTAYADDSMVAIEYNRHTYYKDVFEA